MDIKKSRVVCALSGGVDSSVGAYLLKKEGYDVIAMFMKNWHDDSVIIDNECPWIQDSNDALIVAEKLKIPYYVIDLSEEYKKRIVDYMFEEYKNGRTPNPDVLCNREIKFDLFLRQAMAVDADYIATGHYARIIKKNDFFHLFKGIDPKKDQSYFLCQLRQSQLEKTIFPLGNLTKDEVRKIAKEQGLITANKKDSQGLCFVGKIKLPEFLSQQLKPKAGLCIDIDTKEVIGQHKGAHFYTIGQRKGLGISGSEKPYYVAKINIHTNILYVCQGKDHSKLYSKTIYLKDVNIINRAKFNKDDIFDVQIKYHGKLYTAKIDRDLHDIKIKFINKAYAVTPGQFAVIYKGNELLYSGVIHSILS